MNIPYAVGRASLHNGMRSIAYSIIKIELQIQKNPFADPFDEWIKSNL